ncbi:MAG TPA: aconitase X catalytic domain-containing protein [Leptolyngbyaceae cyanobacterium M33_DOE_097]|nr:aconitase X catalytic domain-containing protein [Leptolyngbyaceae cyanobacterium M33_DOE_097]
MAMKLTTYEQEMLDGVHGEAKKIAMEGLMAFGEAVDAEEMVKVSFVHYIGCQKGLSKDSPEYQQFEWGQGLILEKFWDLGANITTDPNLEACVDPFIVQMDAYEKEGMPWNNKYFKMSKTVYEAAKEGYNQLQATGWLPTYSCTPHFNSAFPIHGEYAACCESSAACYLNSILGVKTNRESAVAAPYAAITGCIPKYGMLLDENRRASVIYELDDDIKNNLLDDPADWAALGGAIAKRANNRIPAILNMPPRMRSSAAKALLACASPGMNDPLLHLIGITPGSATLEDAFGGEVPAGVERIHLSLADVKAMYAELRTAKTDKVDIVHFGCPLLIYEEVHQIAQALKGKKVNKDVMLWVQTDTPSYYMAQHYGDAQIIEEAGGKIYHQTCWGMNALSVDWGSDFTVATNSFKQFKIFGGLGHKVIFGSLDELINAAVTGVYDSTRWDEPLENLAQSYNPSIEDIEEFKGTVDVF